MPKRIAIKPFGSGVGSGRAVVDAETGSPLWRIGDNAWGPNAELFRSQGYDIPANFESTLQQEQAAMQSEQDAGRNEGGGFKQFLSIALPVALAAFGVPVGLAGLLGGGTLGAIGAGAIIGGGVGLLTGNPLKGALLGAAGGFAGSQIFGGAEAATGESVGSAMDYADAGAGAPAAAPASVPTTYGGGMANAIANPGVSAGPSETLNLAGDTGAGENFGMTGNEGSPGGYQPQVNADGSVSWGKRIMGIINSGLETAKENKEIVGPMIVGGSSILGGMGTALLNRDTEEKKLQASRELLSQKTDETAKIEANKRAAIQGGSYFDAPLGFSATGGPLRRPDGTLVYPKGLIRSRMGT